MKSNPHNLTVKSFSLRIYPGQSSNPPASYSGKDLGYMILSGEGTPFFIHFLPDGTVLPKPTYNVGLKAVEVTMNWCQLAPLQTMLATADTVYGIYFEDGSGPWSDVEGVFTRA